MQYLGLCSKLRRLTVEGNLICLKPNADSAEEPDYNYRLEVTKLIPHLEYLDEIPASQTALLPSKKMHEGWLTIKESIKEGALAGDISWLDPTVPDELFPEDDSSYLTHGLSQVICGNPTKALCARRQKLGPPAVRPLKSCGLRTENLYVCGGEDLHQEDRFSKLSTHRKQQKWCLQTYQQEKAAQALKVPLVGEEESAECSLPDSCEDELRETQEKDLIERISLDSSCHSCLSQSSSGSPQAQKGAVSSNLNHCLIPYPPKCPSPASLAGVAARPWKMRNHRVRCLKTPSQEEDGQWTQQCQSRAPRGVLSQPLGKEVSLLRQHSILTASASPGQHKPPGSTSQQRPASGPEDVASTSIRPIMDERCPEEINKPVVCSSAKSSERFRLMNTAAVTAQQPHCLNSISEQS